MIETVLIAIIIAKIKGYKIKPLYKCWEIYPILVFVIIYLLLNMSIFFENYFFIKYAQGLEKIYIFTFLILIIKHDLYKEAIIGSISMIIGTILNKIAIIYNGGKMPVFPTLSHVTGYFKQDVFTKVSDIHVLGNGETKYKILTDIFDLGYSILSIGDIFIRVFVFIIIFNTIKSINKVRVYSSSII